MQVKKKHNLFFKLLLYYIRKLALLKFFLKEINKLLLMKFLLDFLCFVNESHNILIFKLTYLFT